MQGFVVCPASLAALLWNEPFYTGPPGRRSGVSAVWVPPRAAPARLGGPVCPCPPGWLAPRRTRTQLGGKSLCMVEGNVAGRCREVFRTSPREERRGAALPRDRVCCPLCSRYPLLGLKPLRALCGPDRRLFAKRGLVFGACSLFPRWALVKC